MTAVATTEKRAKPPAQVIAGILGNEAAAARITPFLPEGVSVDRVIAAAQLAVMKMPAIAECEPSSIVLACAKIAQWGLEVGDTAHLVPFGKECTPVPDYRGLVEMIVRSGAASHVEARVVREGDVFNYKYGTSKEIEHLPRAKSTEPITHAYAIATLRFGRFDFIVLDRDEIEAVRRKSKQWKNGSLEDCAWYAKKTAVRRVVNLIPKNPALAKVLSTVQEVEDAEFEVVVPADRDPDGPTPAQLAAVTGGKLPPTPLRPTAGDTGYDEVPAGVDPTTGEDFSNE